MFNKENKTQFSKLAHISIAALNNFARMFLDE